LPCLRATSHRKRDGWEKFQRLGAATVWIAAMAPADATR